MKSGVISLENIVNKIIEIDEEAVKLKQQIEKVLRDNEKELKEEIERLENEINENAIKEAEKQYNDIISEATKKAEGILTKGKAEYERLENIYSKIEDNLVEKIFEEIFLKVT